MDKTVVHSIYRDKDMWMGHVGTEQFWLFPT